MKIHFLSMKRVMTTSYGTPCYGAPCGFYRYYPTEKIKKFFTQWRKKITCKTCKRIIIVQGKLKNGD